MSISQSRENMQRWLENFEILCRINVTCGLGIGKNVLFALFLSFKMCLCFLVASIVNIQHVFSPFKSNFCTK